MTERIRRAVEHRREDIIAFTQELVRIESVTGNEERVARAVERRLRELGFDGVAVDRTGNVTGSVGDGPMTVLFDSHTDTVGVVDADSWRRAPFGGEIDGGRLYGRGSVDMKGALAVSIYAAAAARELGLLAGKRIVISASVMEEDYDGVALRCLLEDSGLRPDYAVFGEATGLRICRGHNGRALIGITVNGKAAHGSKPELGVNPVYCMQPVIARVQALAAELSGRPGWHGTLALTNISCVTASNNSVPQSAEIVLDRRLCAAESMATVEAEMAGIMAGVDGSWRICDVPGKTWTGREITLHSYLSAWELGEEAPLVRAAKRAGEAVLGRAPDTAIFSYTTNAVVTAGDMGIPTIVFGPGDTGVSHGKDEFCPVDELIEACRIYVQLCAELA